MAPLIGRTYTAIYLGDFDPSGEDIERNARRYLDSCFTTWKRIAVTPAGGSARYSSLTTLLKRSPPMSGWGCSSTAAARGMSSASARS